MRRLAVGIALAASLLACSQGNVPDTHPPLLSGGRPVARALLKFQDSSGYTVRALPTDSFGASLRNLVEWVGGQPAVRRDAKSIVDERGVGYCMCHAPYDSLILEYADGSRQAYLFSCSSVYRESPEASLLLRMEETESRKTDIRWDKVRARYCPKGFGCTDGAPRLQGWEISEEVRFQGEWRTLGACRELEDSLSAMLDARDLPHLDIGFRAIVHVKDKRIGGVTLDSADAPIRDLAAEVGRKVLGLSKGNVIDYDDTCRIRAFNLSAED